MAADWDRNGETVIVSVAFTDEAVATAFAGPAVPEQLSHSSFLGESCGRLASRLWRVDTYFGNNRRGLSPYDKNAVREERGFADTVGHEQF